MDADTRKVVEWIEQDALEEVFRYRRRSEEDSEGTQEGIEDADEDESTENIHKHNQLVHLCL